MYSVIIIESTVLLCFSHTPEQSVIPILISAILVIVGMVVHFLYYTLVYPWPLRTTDRPLSDVLCSREKMDVRCYPSLLDNEGQNVLINFKVGGLEIEVATPKTSRTPKTPRSRSRIAFNIPDEETEM